MKQLQVSAPADTREEVNNILQNYSSEISLSEAEKNDEEIVKFTATVESEQIDELTKKLKNLDGIDVGDLSISVLKQESLIKKGRATESSGTMLSNEEIYSKSKEHATFNNAEWGLITISAVIAAYGLVADNIIVVIGAMMLSPILSPFVSGALSITAGDRTLMVKSLKTGILSAFISVFAASIAVIPFTVDTNSLIMLITSVTVYNILLSMFVGVAGALTFVTGLRDQIAGVAVAIALIPPLASVGIGISILDINLVLNALTIATMNMSAVLISGFATFHLIGLKPTTYYKKKQAERIRFIIPLILAVFCIVALYSTYDPGITQEQFISQAEDHYGSELLDVNFEGDKAVLYVVGDVNTTQFEEELDHSIELETVRLQEIY